MKTLLRCPWAEGSDAYRLYHDTEWGVPVRDDRVFFEFLLLEGAQAGLSWSTILARRSGYAAAFAQFDVAKVARFTQAKVDRLANEPSIVRHRGKIESAVTNARAFIQVQHEFGSFADYAWQFVGGTTKINRFRSLSQVPATTKASESLSKDLKRREFRFVGPTIVYAFMQATGLVNDHLITCPRWAEAAEKPGQR